MITNIKKLYDQNGRETGAILSVVIGISTNIQQKNTVEDSLVQYAFDTLYPNEGLIIYSDMNIDTPSITVIRNFNNLPDQKITI
jgi:hypothetical protein